jgi:hypothetical protein
MFLVALSLAAAQETTPPPAATATDTEPAPVKKRKFLMEVGFRGRYMDVPDSILDIWYFNNQDDDTIPDRPHISAYSLGIEFIIKDKQANGIFYVEYLNPMLDAGYWDDKEDPADHLDGSWMEPDKFGLVLIGANYAYEIKATNWLSFMFGAGLGGAIKIGNLNVWDPGEDPSNPDGNNDNTDVDCGSALSDRSAAYFRVEDGCASDGAIETPPAIPYVDVNIGPRFNIADRASIRIEGGIHMLLPYGGASVGIVF